MRLLDVGMFRVGSEQYAEEDSGVGLATVLKEHVNVHGDAIEFDYPGKGGTRRLQVIEDPVTIDLITSLKRRRGGPAELLAYRERRRWRNLRSDDINEYLKEQLGDEFSAKDFRTWNATVMAAVTLAANGREATSKTARKRAINESVRAVAELLGNTPAVARRSYIDPRVFDRYRSGWTIAGALERIRTSTSPTIGCGPRWSGRSSICWSKTPSRTASSRPRPRSCGLRAGRRWRVVSRGGTAKSGQTAGSRPARRAAWASRCRRRR